MVKPFDVLLIAVMLGAAAWTFKVKHEAEEIDIQLARTERAITGEREAIAVLSADWTLLDQPSRLQGLYDTYKADLGLEPLRPEQIAEPNELPAPAKMPGIDETTGERLAANARKSNAQTGVR